jgi:hypothetical protein
VRIKVLLNGNGGVDVRYETVAAKQTPHTIDGNEARKQVSLPDKIHIMCVRNREYKERMDYVFLK